MTRVYEEPPCAHGMSAKSDKDTFCSDTVNSCRLDSKTEHTCEFKKKMENNHENEDATVHEKLLSAVIENHSSCYGFMYTTRLISCGVTKNHRWILYEIVISYKHFFCVMVWADNRMNLPNIDHRWVRIIDESLASSKNTHQTLDCAYLLIRSNNVMPYSIYNISLTGRLQCMNNLNERIEEVLTSSVRYFGVSLDDILEPTTYFVVYTALGVLYISFIDMQLVTEIDEFKFILNILYHINDTFSNCIVFLTCLNVFGLVRSTFRSLSDTKSDSRCVMEMSWIESEHPSETVKSLDDNDVHYIQEGDVCSYNVDISEKQISHLLDDVLPPLPSQELSVTIAEPAQNISLKLQYVKQRCKLIPDAVDLKPGQHNEDNKQLNCSLATDISAESKHDIENGENIDLMKEIKRNTTQPFTSHHDVYTIAPVSRAQYEKDNKVSSSSSDRTLVEMDSFHSESIHHHEHDARQAEDTHMTSEITPLMERRYDCEEIACIEQPDSSVVQIDAPGAHSQVCNEELPQMKASTRTVQHSEDTIITECSNVTEDSSLSTVVSSNNVSSENLPNPGVDQTEIQRFEPLMQVINKLADGQRVPPQITMRYEMLRFCTLRSFPNDNKPYIMRIAEAGFYYANNGDEVVCYCCAWRKRNWQETDIPMDIHRQMNPTCSFLVRNSEVNVSIKMQSPMLNNLSAAPNSTLTVLPSGQNHTPPQSRQYAVRDNAINTTAVNNTAVNMVQHTGQGNSVPTRPATSTAQNTSQNQETLDLPKQTSASNYATAQSRVHSRAHGNFVQAISSESSNDTTQFRQAQFIEAPGTSGAIGNASSANGIEGTAKAAMPKYPKYASKTVRLASFNDCGHILITPERLAESGLFYAGFGDCVRCFQCGVGLRHWSVEDDPWIEHSRWGKECSFVSQRRGHEFVNLVQMAVAVQNSENYQNQTPDDRTSLPNEGGNQIQQDREETDNLMHTDAAQSVLEMGYHPNIIRQAIRRVLGQRGREGISAVSLMEIIFEIEAETTPDIDQPVEHSTTENSPPQSSHNTVTTREEPGHSQESNSLVPTTYSPLPTTSTNTAGSSRSNTITENRAASRPAVSASRSTVTPPVSPNTSMTQLQSKPSTSSGAQTSITRKSQLLEQKKLKAENEKLKQQSICSTCNKNDVSIVFLPCGHLITCVDCAPTIRYCTVSTCGKYIKGTVRTYLA